MYINRPHGQRGRGRILSSKARAFKEEVRLKVVALVGQLGLSFDVDEEYGLFIEMYTRRMNRDVSNIIKITEDAVFDAAGINDSHDMTVIVQKNHADDDYCIVYFGLERDVINVAFRVL